MDYSSHCKGGFWDLVPLGSHESQGVVPWEPVLRGLVVLYADDWT